MTSKLSGLNRDYDQRTEFGKAAQALLKLDAKGCRIAKVIAQAMADFANWDPADPMFEEDFGRTEGAERYTAFAWDSML